MRCKNVLYVALTAAIAGFSANALAAVPPLEEMDSVPVTASPDAAALGAATRPRMVGGDVNALRLIDLEAPPQEQLSEMNQRRRLSRNKAGVPLQVGFARAVPKNKVNIDSVPWEKLRDGSYVARFQIVSATAKAMRVAISLEGVGAQPGDPAAVKLYFSGNDGRVFEYSGSSFSGNDAGWSPAVAGEAITMEIVLPAGQLPEAFALSVTQLSHLDIDPAAGDALLRPAVGESGACQQDVMCRVNPSADFIAASNAVARMLFSENGTTYLCSGTLLNNDNLPKKHLFWTAAHCLSTQAAADTVQTYWFYQAAACGGELLNPNYVTLTGGAYLRHADTGRDATLLELKKAPPPGAAYVGWNSAPIASVNTPVEAIHHPYADVKKYSLGTVTGLDARVGTALMYSVEWDVGVNESGSSGSGLFTISDTGSYHLRGGLLGGLSECSAPREPDFYSRFSDVYPAIQQYLNP